VCFKILCKGKITKSSNVEDPDVVAGGLERDGFVDPAHYVVEEAAVQSFGQSVTCAVCFIHFQRHPEHKKFS